MSSTEIFNYLRGIDCCKTCCLRFLNGRGLDYQDVDAGLKRKNVELEVSDEPNDKRVKRNVCVACLDILSPEVLTNVAEKVSQMPEVVKYECDKALTSVSLPMILSLRQLSIWIALLEKFGATFENDEPPDVPLKEVLKVVLNPVICKNIGKMFDQNGMMINTFFSHEDETAEMEKLALVDPALFNERSSNRRFRREFMTRNAFEKHFTPARINVKKYCEHIAVPPRVTNTAIQLDNITVAGPTVFVAGRYRKLSRDLSQSPWVLEGKRVMATSVQEIMVEQLAPFFDVPNDSMIFSSSGREDVDVRCLGKGRPFVLEIPDSKKICLPQNVAAEMERKIDASGQISVHHLQMVRRDDLVHIKMGEEKKKKLYRALCLLRNDATVEVLQKLNIKESFIIEQKTPIRVLHRRPLLTRPRSVFSIKAAVAKDNPKIVVLDLVTQAGTYIKELVHGDCGRTIPSLTSIIGEWIDIVALDVVGVDLDWPKEIDNKIAS